jgi:hypothetical protein
MKVTEKNGLVKGNSFTFNKITLEGFSYKWWQVSLKLDENTVLFNNYKYSQTTARHQHEILRLLKEQQERFGFRIFTVSISEGLQDKNAVVNFVKNNLKTISTDNEIREWLK